MAKNTAPASTFTPGETNARAVRTESVRQTPQRDGTADSTDQPAADAAAPGATSDTAGSGASESAGSAAASGGKKPRAATPSGSKRTLGKHRK